MSDFYPELQQQQKLIENTTKDEESRFLKTLDQGTEILNSELKKLENKGQKTLPGNFAFKLYDTFGFPLDLTQLMTQERGLSVDEVGFTQQMQKAKEKARASWKGKGLSIGEADLIGLTNSLKSKFGPTQFTGYVKSVEEGQVQMIYNGSKQKFSSIVDVSSSQTIKAGETGFVAFDKTCFYAEGGGQVGDSGTLSWTTGEDSGSAQVYDCTKLNDIHLLQFEVTEGQLKVGDTCKQEIDLPNRKSIQNNHSATHLLHAALRKTLGDHVTQAGSLVEPERLRFDFTHNQPLSSEEILQIENRVNSEIAKGSKVSSQVMPHKKALEVGALALFGEKYGDEVRVIKMGEFSTELCGGTHVDNVEQIRLLKIVSEGGVSAGVRRIEAISGNKAVEFVMKHTRENQQVRELLGVKSKWTQFFDETTNLVFEWIEKLREENKELQKNLHAAKGQQIDIDSFIDTAKTFSNAGQSGRLVLADVAIDDRKLLSEITDKIKDKIQSGIVVVVGEGNGSYPIIVTVSKNLVGLFKAGEILSQVANEMGGRGGGRPDFAQGAGKDRSKIGQAFAKAQSIVN